MEEEEDKRKIWDQELEGYVDMAVGVACPGCVLEQL